MTYVYDGSNWLLKFNKGELLVKGLTDFVFEKNIDGSWISGLGGVLWAEIGHYDLDKQEYFFSKAEDVPELLSLQGNIAWMNGEPALHLHGVFSKADLSAIGGHIKEVAVGGTVEVFVHHLKDTKLTRSQDPLSGLNTLDV